MSGKPASNSELTDRGHELPNLDAHAADDGRWFAYELHDGLLQWVIGARLQTQAALAAAAETDSIAIDEHRICIARIKVLLDKAAEEGRSLIRFIDTVSDEPVDIYVQLEQFCESAVSGRQSAKTPAAELTRDQPPWPSLPTRRAWSVLRILQQAIQNAISHSQADRLEVHLGWADAQTLTAIVKDNGIGFDTAAEFPNHYGLRTMKHRAAMCSGTLLITSAPGLGCQVRLALPV